MIIWEDVISTTMYDETQAIPADESAPLDPRRRRVAISALAVLAAVLTVLCAVLAVQQRSHSQHRQRLEDARAAAVRAARQEILNLDGLSAATIDRDLGRVLDGATGTFGTEFRKSQGNLKTIITTQKTVSSGAVVAAGVVRADDATATVLVAVDRRVKDTSNAQGVVAHDRWQLDLEQHGGRWLVTELQPVS